jgi:hypothetical protein
MSDPLTTSIITAVISGLVGGTGVALLNNLLNKRKTNAEIQKVQAEAEKTSAETEKIKAELRTVTATVSYTLANSAEELLIDGRSHIDGFDVKGSEGQFWDNNSQPISPKGRGELKFEDGGVLNVKRTNTDGRFELLFQRYIYKTGEHPLIPKDDLISGRRKLRVGGEAKSAGADHTLLFMLRDPSTKEKLAVDRVRVTTSQWTSFQVFLSADPNVDCQLRIDDEEVSRAPSSVQLRNIILTQRN